MPWRRRSSTTSRCRRARTRGAGTGRAARCPTARAGPCTARPRSARPATGPAATARAPSADAAASRSARSSTRPSRPRSESGLNSLSMQNSARWVLPVRSTSRWRNRRSTSHGGDVVALTVELAERDLELVEGVVAGLVDARRLAGRADEPAGEQVRQRRVVLPVGDQAAQQVGAAQQRAVGGVGAAERHVVAAAGAGVGAVELELLGAEPGQPGLGVERLDDRRAAPPTTRWAGR